MNTVGTSLVPAAPPPPLGQLTGRVLPGFAVETRPRRPGSAREGARIVSGRLRLGGELIIRDPAGPRLWDLALSPAAMQEAQAMSWLDHLAALGGIGARQTAQTAVFSWIDRDEAHGWDSSGPARDPATIGLRVISWSQHAGMITQHRRKQDQRRFVAALERQLRLLADAAPRMSSAADARVAQKATALAGLLIGASALSATRFLLEDTGQALAALAPDLIDAKGGCASRNPQDLLTRFELLLWSADALSVAGFTPDPAHLAALERAAPVLRALRHGDGQLASFHGASHGATGRLDRALADCDRRNGALAADPMGFARLSAGCAVVLADSAAPPDGAGACAGCLGFEFTWGAHPIILAPGSGTRFGPGWGQAARSTAMASAPGLAGAALVQSGPDGRLRQDDLQVWARQEGLSLHAGHDGYRAQGVLIQRDLTLAPDGNALHGRDLFDPIAGAPVDATAELRFHLAPGARARIEGPRIWIWLAPPADTPADLAASLPPEGWVLTLPEGAEAELTPSACLHGCREAPLPTLQIRLSAPIGADPVRFDWTLAKARVTPAP